MSLVYLDTSVALAHLLGDDVFPPDGLWKESLVSSRLISYEMWTRLGAMDLRDSHGAAAEEILSRVATVEMVSPILERASDGFGHPVRTLDALHLASLLFLMEQGQSVRLASYDQRLNVAALGEGVLLYELAGSCQVPSKELDPGRRE